MVNSNKKRLNLGSGKDYMQGWINVDVQKNNKLDIAADLNKKFPFENNSIDEIKASDILEHFTKEEGEKFLNECYRVLKNNGIITIRTHNIYQIFKQFKNDPYVLIHFLYGDTSETGIFGSHKYAYTLSSLKKLFIRLGFELMSDDKEQTNIIVTARKTMRKKLSKLKIGIVIQTPDIGGAETYMHSLVSEFIHEGNDVYLASNNKRFLRMFHDLRIKLFEIPIIIDIMGNLRGLIKTVVLSPVALFYYIKIMNKYKKENIKVILMSGFTEKLLVSCLSIIYHIPVVWIEYGPLKTIFKRNFYIPKIMYRLLNKIPKNIIVPSQNTAQSLITDARCSIEKLVMIPCGTSMNKHIKKNAKNFSENFKNRFIICNISRATTEKGQDYLIKSMPMVLKMVPNAYLILVGDGWDLPFYKKLIKDLDIEKYVLCTGFVEDTTVYYAMTDVFVFPTVWELEGFGLVVPEAMSFKIPVIASNIGPVPEIVDNERTGILVPPKNVKLLADAIIRLAKDKELRKQLGENGYNKAIEQYDIRKIAEKYIEILRAAVLYE